LIPDYGPAAQTACPTLNMKTRSNPSCKSRKSSSSEVKKENVEIRSGSPRRVSRPPTSGRRKAVAPSRRLLAHAILIANFPRDYAPTDIDLPPTNSIAIGNNLDLTTAVAREIQQELRDRNFSSLGGPIPSAVKGWVSFADPFESSASVHSVGQDIVDKASHAQAPAKWPLAPRACRKQRRVTEYRECVVCAETKPLGRHGANFPRFPKCTHDPATCISCVAKHALITLKTRATVVFDDDERKGSVDWAACTCPQCNVSLSEGELRFALSRKDMVLLNEVATRKALESHPRWVWCLSPTCSAGQIFPHATKQSPKVTCVECGAQSCFLHRIPWHEGFQCGEYDDRHPNAQSIRSSEERIKRMSKKCPTRRCGWRIQKDGGCPNMICGFLSSPFP
jgi:hypothetical protein